MLAIFFHMLIFAAFGFIIIFLEWIILIMLKVEEYPKELVEYLKAWFVGAEKDTYVITNISLPSNEEISLFEINNRDQGLQEEIITASGKLFGAAAYSPSELRSSVHCPH